MWEYEVSTESHSMTGLRGDVLEQIVRAKPTGEGAAPS